MMNPDAYRAQVDLLLKVLPEVAKERAFALHGGTAINLFVRNMPRLSVDIDLTYVPIEDRDTSIEKINTALVDIKHRIEKVVPGVNILHKSKVGKLLIHHSGVDIKIETNLVGRGILAKEPTTLTLCERAESDYNAFVEMQVVPFGQLYGGKICAALDRQHPRDLFDIKYLLENEGLSQEALTGFIFALVCHDRPMVEVLNPNLLDQQLAMSNQFIGMTAEAFSYTDFENVRKHLINEINAKLTEKDKAFLISVKNLTPDWSIYKFECFPAVRWKLRNLEILKSKNPKKFEQQLNQLRHHFKTQFV